MVVVRRSVTTNTTLMTHQLWRCQLDGTREGIGATSILPSMEMGGV